jgi:hypothetical protein
MAEQGEAKRSAVQRKAGGVSVATVEDEEVVAGYAMPLPVGVSMRSVGQVAAMTGRERAEVVRRVFGWMAEGHTMTAAAQACGLRPSAVRRWIAGDAAWMAKYDRARKLQAQAMADEAVQVARDSTNQTAAGDRLLVDTLRWAASKAAPREFGDKQVVEHSGGQRLEIRVVEDDPKPSYLHQPQSFPHQALKAAEAAVLVASTGKNP